MHILDTLIQDINKLNDDFFLKHEGNQTQASLDERPYPLNTNKKIIRFSITQNTYLVIMQQTIVTIGKPEELEAAKNKFYQEFLKAIIFHRLPMMDEAQFRYSVKREQL